MTLSKKNQIPDNPEPDHSAEVREPPNQPSKDTETPNEGAEGHLSMQIPVLKQYHHPHAVRQSTNKKTQQLTS